MFATFNTPADMQLRVMETGNLGPVKKDLPNQSYDEATKQKGPNRELDIFKYNNNKIKYNTFGLSS